MINGLNTGGFDIQDSSAAANITDRALTMLSQYLVSNQVILFHLGTPLFESGLMSIART